MTQPLPVVSLFSGTGGLDLAAESVTSSVESPIRDGVAQVRVSVEWGDEECDTLRANFDGPVVQGDITQLSAEEILDVGGLGPGDPTLVVGGPPCTPFSKSGFWLDYKRESRDPNASLLDDYVRVVDHARPEAFLMENVQGLTYRTHADQFARLIQSLKDLGYTTQWKLMNAAEHGVPQLRKRVFVVGRRDGLPFHFPEATHSGWSEHSRHVDPSKVPFVASGEVLKDLLPGTPERGEIADGTFGELLVRIPPGENYLYFSERGPEETHFEWRSRYWTFLLRLDPMRPSSTLQAQPGPWVGPFHWENVENADGRARARRLRTPELLRLMTFPDGYKVVGDLAAVHRQLGNAVPVEFGRVVLRSLLEQLGHLEPHHQTPGGQLAAF
ncbi:MAG: DNA cytosine methyltransferase [Acidimicrobiia bacterium]